MALELNIHPRTIWLAQQVARRPEFYWDEHLEYKDKLRLYTSPLELDVLTNKQIRDFEREMAIRGDLGAKAMIKEIAAEKVRGITA